MVYNILKNFQIIIVKIIVKKLNFIIIFIIFENSENTI